jgi:hypothetical protein
VVPKEDSDLMKAVASGLDMAKFFGFNVPAHKNFMEDFATTIGSVSGLPKSIRDVPLHKIEVLAHESQHVLQYYESKIAFAWLYLTDSMDRAQYEVDAYATGLAVRTWLTGVPPRVEDVDGTLNTLVQGYHLRPDDVVYARPALLSHLESIKDGVRMTKSTRVSLEFLETRYPHLRGTVAWS